MALPISYNVRNVRSPLAGEPPRRRSASPSWSRCSWPCWPCATGSARAPRHRDPRERHGRAARLGLRADLLGAPRPPQQDRGRLAGGHRRRTARPWPLPRSWSWGTCRGGPTASPTNVTIRGVTPKAFEVRGGIEIVQGRRFTPGLYEVIVGERIAERIEGLDLGAAIPLQRHDWKIVGIFTLAGRRLRERDLGRPRHHGGTASGAPAARTRWSCASRIPRTLEAFDKWIRDDPEMQLQAVEEREVLRGPGGRSLEHAPVPGELRLHHHGHRRRLRRHEHDVRHRGRPHPRDRHPARPGLLAAQHPVLVRGRVGAAGARRRRCSAACSPLP